MVTTGRCFTVTLLRSIYIYTFQALCIYYTVAKIIWVLRRISGPKREDVTGEWIKLQDGEVHNLYSSPDIIRQIKSRTIR
jgi:hypothetical protein